MFKIPITKEGDIRYIELIKITVLIALLINAYTHIVRFSVLNAIFAFVEVSSVLVFFVILQGFILATLELIHLIALLTKPIMSYINRTLVLPIVYIARNVFKLTKIDITTHTIYQLQVIRC